MRIEFTCKTNKDYCMINTLKAKLTTGSTITLDRNETEYDISEDGTLSMTWLGVYIWAIDECFIFGSNGNIIDDEYSVQELNELLENAEYEFELEDDAPDEDYSVEIKEISIG